MSGATDAAAVATAASSRIAGESFEQCDSEQLGSAFSLAHKVQARVTMHDFLFFDCGTGEHAAQVARRSHCATEGVRAVGRAPPISAYYMQPHMHSKNRWGQASKVTVHSSIKAGIAELRQCSRAGRVTALVAGRTGGPST